MLRLLLQGKATPHARNRRAHRQLPNGRRISSAASTFDYPFGSSMILLTPAAVSCTRREDRVCCFYRQTRVIGGFSGQVRRLGFSVAPCHFVAGAATRCAIALCEFRPSRTRGARQHGGAGPSLALRDFRHQAAPRLGDVVRLGSVLARWRSCPWLRKSAGRDGYRHPLEAFENRRVAA